MANHLTPTELAREAGLERRDVIASAWSWASRSSRAGSTRPCSSRACSEQPAPPAAARARPPRPPPGARHAARRARALAA